MDAREKLAELLREVQYLGGLEEKVADHLIAHGVTVQEDCEACAEATRNCIADLQEYISELSSVQEWISVKDRLPDNKEHDWVLAQIVDDNGFMHIPKVMEYRQQRNDWLEETYGWLSEHNGAFTVTHWMPLPQPPKGELMKKCSAKAFAMCPDRAVCGSLNEAVYMEGSDCEKFNEAADKQPMTNAGCIRAMNDEELSEFLCSILSKTRGGCSECVAADYCYPGHTGMIDYLKEDEW